MVRGGGEMNGKDLRPLANCSFRLYILPRRTPNRRNSVGCVERDREIYKTKFGDGGLIDGF